MRCPRCNRESFSPYGTCAHCQFSGTPHQIEELGHVAYLLGELEAWEKVGPNTRKWLRERYLRRREELEIDLGLRPPPLTPEEARKLQWEIFCLGEFLKEVEHWSEVGWIHPENAGRLREGAQKRVTVQRERLEGVPSDPPFYRWQNRLGLLDYLEGMAQQALQRHQFVDEIAGAAALSELRVRRESLEVEAGLRPPPKPVPIVEVAPAAPPPPKPPRPPREPITWDRIWQTLLTERTLNVLLFLGAFLMVASAITYVVYNWENLPPAAQLAAIVLFTLSFYGAGWFLRVRMGLRASGIAVTAVGSLLVPLDFYAVFVAGGVLPEEMWPWVWLVASAVCLPIYALTALRIRAQFFGYLVAVAAGSLICAILQVLDIPEEWWLSALVALALVAALLAYRLKGSEKAWSILGTPLRFSGLVATSVILPLAIGWWVASGAVGFHFDASLATAWTLGAFLYAYAAVQEQSRWLGRAAATALPVSLFMLLRLVFEPLGVELPWYALGWAALAPGYLLVGHRFHSRVSSAGAEEASVLRAHSHTATGWGLALMPIAAVWSAFDQWAAAVTYAVLAAGIALAARLWRRPGALPLVSLLAFLSLTYGMAAGHLAPAELCLGWALLALLHVLVALRMQATARPGSDTGAYTARLYGGSLVCAAAAVLPPLVLGDEPLLTYALGNWITLAAWLAYLDRRGEQAGLTALLRRFGPLRQSALHWAMALPLPFFVALLYTHFRTPDAWLGLLLAGLAWILFAVGQSRLVTSPTTFFRHWSTAWYIAGYGCSLAAPLLAYHYYDQPLLAVTALLASVLYFASAWAFRFRWWLVPAGLVLPLGLLILMDYWTLSWPQQSLSLALVVALYLLGGVWLELRPGASRRFVAPLYAVAHLVAIFTLAWGLYPAIGHLFDAQDWTDPARLWAAGGQLVLGIAYGLFAWFRIQERWAHVAAWLGVLAGGLVASVFSQGRGSSAFQAALLAAAYVFVERALASPALWRRWPRVNLAVAKAWPVYRRALLIAGWAVSAGAVTLALLRNLVLLGGGRVQASWAIAGLLLVTTLYALSAWLFRRRIFLWLAGVLIIAPWTLLTAWGWFLWDAPPPLPRYALAWAILACLELLLGLVLTSLRVEEGKDFGFPLRVVANALLPFALFWAVADSATSSLTWGLGLAFYVVSALTDYRRGLAGWRGARFLYPAVAVAPVWAIYLLHHLLPTAPYESYGLLLLAFALPLLALGRRLRRIDSADGLPLYLGTYGVAIAGTLLVAHQRPLFAAALTFDALLCVLSAWLFREPLWGYPAAALAPAAMLVALAESQVPVDRRGWWLIGLGAVLLVIAWILRHARKPEYATPPLVMAFVAVALGLPPSSLDRAGAFWGYLAAGLIYALAAAWLRQPLLLAASAALSAVPYGVALVWLDVDPANYGLALFPGVIATLALAHLFDWRLGRLAPILATDRPQKTARPLATLLDWWAAPGYAWGYIGALVAVGLSLPLRSGQAWGGPARLAMALAMASLVFVHATLRFRLRGFLLLAGALAQGAVLAVIDLYGWLGHPAWAALAFLPVTAVTAALALVVELWRREGSPLGARWAKGWSRPLYLLLAADLLIGQVAALFHNEPGAIVTLAHALLLALLATVWVQPILPFLATGLGVVGLFQAMAWANLEVTGYPVGLALMALGYGLLGYGLQIALSGRQRAQVWSRPLEWMALGLSAVALVWSMVTALDVADLLVRTALGRPVVFGYYAHRVQMVMWVLGLCGLLYLATAVVRRWYVLGYGAVALLLGSWAMWWRFFLDMPGVQWYAVPAGLYLLGVGWMEWRQGHKTLAGWIDRVGMVVWLGTAWWQSLPGVMDNGWPYALLMGAESLLLVWWGSARRQRQFLYAGAVALVLNVVTQAIEPLLSVNRWIVFGIAGLLLVSLAVLVERNLKKIRELSAEMRIRLEGWE
jgi:hypothetical protein